MNRRKIIISLALVIACIAIISVYGSENEHLNTYIKNGKIVEYGDFSKEDDYKKIKPIDNKYNKYIDYALGYTLNYPNHMNVDVTLSAVKTIIADEETQIEIYYDNFKDTVHSTLTYINYSNKFLQNSKELIKEREEKLYINGMETHLLEWHRDKLVRINKDKNYYVSVEIIKNKNEAYTIFIKSANPFKNQKDYMNIINSFKVIKKKGEPKINTVYKNVNRNLNIETTNFYNKYFLESNSLKWGIFENTAPESFDFLNTLEKKLDYTFEFLVRYQTFSSGGFPMQEMLNAHQHGRYVELTFQTMNLDERDNSSVIYDILNGKYDDFFNLYAKEIREFNHPILFRLNNEMNGDWCIYSSYYASKDTELFKAVWRYVYKIFKDNGVDNVIWVWNPHDGSFPDFKWNHYLNYYPGDEYVDVIGLTGYNTGTYYPGEKWREFNDIYIPLYNEYMELFKKPFMVTEFGSNSVGGDKIKWINEMFDTMDKLENIKVAIWWNGIDWDTQMNPARIYRLDENENIIRTFKTRLKDYR